MRDIKVSYDGEYPNTCSGTLKIVVDGEEVYNKKYCCTSNGNCYFTNDFAEGHVENGNLIWNDADKFDVEIQTAVEDCLSGFYVCCGGCL